MTYTLFLDDERMPPSRGANWIIARSSHEAIHVVKKLGIPDFISFDHDLGHDDTAMVFVKWLIEYDLDNNLIKPEFAFTVHSANPVGAENIRSLMSSYLLTKFKN